MRLNGGAIVACDRAMGARTDAVQPALVDFASEPPRVVRMGLRFQISEGESSPSGSIERE